MRTRISAWMGVAIRRPLPLSIAIRRAFKKGYGPQQLRADVMAGLVVGIVALPLSMALAIAVGAPPQQGLYTAVVGGIVAALTGGSKFQVTGPTAAFVVVLAPILTKFGLAGLLTAGLMAGMILIAIGLARFGKFIQYIPNPVTTGFTSGIAVVIATLQLKDLFGLPIAHMPESYVEKLETLWAARSGASLAETAVAASTLALLLILPRLIKRVPAPLLAIALIAAVTAGISHFDPGFHLATLGSRFHVTIGGHTYAGIPPIPPHPIVPWGPEPLSFHVIRELLPAALAIAMLGAIESLLSGVIADGMTGTRHDPNGELIGQGMANIVAPFFGGIAATGALARTATNVRAGAQSPIAAVVHSLVVLLSIVLLAPLVAYIPMSSLAALLLLVAWNMSERRHFAHILGVATRGDVLVLVVCFLLTVFFDMVVAVGVGVVLAALLFMKRMAELTQSRAILAPHRGSAPSIADEDNEGAGYQPGSRIVRYEIAGPLFFGAASEAMNQLELIHSDVRVVVLDLSRVPSIDATGVVALESAVETQHRGRRHVIISGPLPEPRRVFERAELSQALILATIEQSMAKAEELLDAPPASAAPPSQGSS